MSRTKSLTGGDPLWATAISKMDPGVAGIVRELWGLIQRSPSLAPYLWMGSGWRTGSTEHSSGRAIDIIATENTMQAPTEEERAAAMAMIDWLIEHGDELKIQWILFSRDGKPRTESYNMDRGSWNQLADRGSISANHVDHFHIYFKEGATWPAALDGAVVGESVVIDDPTPPETAGDGAPADERDPIIRLIERTSERLASLERRVSEFERKVEAAAGNLDDDLDQVEAFLNAVRKAAAVLLEEA